MTYSVKLTVIEISKKGYWTYRDEEGNTYKDCLKCWAISTDSLCKDCSKEG